MYSNIVKDLYIGKSKLLIQVNDKTVEDTTLIGKILLPTGYQGNMPDYGTHGTLWEELPGGKKSFEITPHHPDHKLYVTGIPKGAILDNFRLQGSIWSSYYEDDIRGYLFQIIPIDIEPKLIIYGSN